MPFRSRFDCLWCGRSWDVRAPTDLEGWAALCSDCLGRAGENPFLAFRLRQGLAARAAAGDDDRTPADQAWCADLDDWYLRRGRFARGPLIDLPWTMELDAVTGWLDSQPLGGRILEPAAGTGWWSPLLAGKGELWLHEQEEPALEVARERLLAHHLRAHLHPRGPWEPPERPVDSVFLGLTLSRAGGRPAGASVRRVLGWLRPGGTLVVIEAAAGQPLPGPQGSATWTATGLERVLDGAGFFGVEVGTTGQAFVHAVARRPEPGPEQR